MRQQRVWKQHPAETGLQQGLGGSWIPLGSDWGVTSGPQSVRKGVAKLADVWTVFCPKGDETLWGRLRGATAGPPGPIHRYEPVGGLRVGYRISRNYNKYKANKSV